jgi:uncharacterized protein YndB with AHSA1/START domain
MIQFQHRIQIDAAPVEVFAMLTDLDRIPEWQRNVIEVTKRTPGAVRAGTMAGETLKMMGRRQASVRVVAYTPVELVAFAGDAGFVDYYCAFELTPVGAGTSLVGRTEFKFHGLWKLLQPLLAGSMRRETAKELAALKRLVESGGVAVQAAPAN